MISVAYKKNNITYTLENKIGNELDVTRYPLNHHIRAIRDTRRTCAGLRLSFSSFDAIPLSSYRYCRAECTFDTSHVHGGRHTVLTVDRRRDTYLAVIFDSLDGTRRRLDRR